MVLSWYYHGSIRTVIAKQAFYSIIVWYDEAGREKRVDETLGEWCHQIKGKIFYLIKNRLQARFGSGHGWLVGFQEAQRPMDWTLNGLQAMEPSACFAMILVSQVI